MTMRIGLIGCGNISDIYLLNARLFRDIEFVACADINDEAAKRQASRYAISAMSPKDLLASSEVDIVLNLTIPEAHAEISQAALEAGKHVYGEKPLATNLADGVKLADTARARGLHVGCAPDTVLGASIQEARRLIDAGAIGRPLLGVASILGHGMEHWHPNPGFFFRPGGGPVFDMGPYYLTTLVTLLGPVASIVALGQIGFKERVISAPNSPLLGQSIKVETLTSAQALLQFESGAQITFLASWDVWNSGVPPIELYGESGSMRVPDPNWFGGDIGISTGRGDWSAIETKGQRFGQANWPSDKPVNANYRGLGLAEMARALEEKRPHRANGDVALHVLAVMAGILEAATEGRPVKIAQRCERPQLLEEAEAKGLLAKSQL
jgi:predicted dehydrogenase